MMEKDRGEGESLHSRSATTNVPSAHSDINTIKPPIKEYDESKSIVTIKPLSLSGPPWVNQYAEPEHRHNNAAQAVVQDNDTIAETCESVEIPEDVQNNTSSPKFHVCRNIVISPKYPPGMELISDTEAVIVRPEKENLDVFSGYDGTRRIQIVDSFGKPMYYGIESSGWCSTIFFKRSRAFKMTILDKSGSEVMIVHKISKCCGCLFASCCSKVFVSLANGFSLGTVTQRCGSCGCCCPSYVVKDSKATDTLLINAIYKFCFRCKPKFLVQASNGYTIGELSKDWGGLGRESMDNPPDFGIAFPRHLDGFDKALLMAVVIFVDAIFS